MLFRRVVFYALLIGVMSGLVLTIAQTWQVVPIIQGAEEYEGASVAVAPIGHGGHEHGEDEWAPADGWERTVYTGISNMMMAAGLAMIVLVVMLGTNRDGDTSRLDWRYGLLWSVGGYVSFYLAPAIGMPPEIPLQSAAPLEQRQVWWVLAVLCTGTGLLGLAFGKHPWRWAMPVLVLVPYLLGAPHHPAGPMFPDQPPAAAAELERLAQEFFMATALANAVFWLVLGLASAYAARRMVRSGVVTPPASTLDNGAATSE